MNLKITTSWKSSNYASHETENLSVENPFKSEVTKMN